MIKLINICKSYDGKIIFNNLTYTFNDSEITTIIAPNGTGKTTLLSLISGLLKADSGTIEYSYPNGYKDINIVLSGEKNLYMKNTVLENLHYFGVIRGMSTKEINRQIEVYASYLPVYDEIKNKVVENLSYGQKRLVAIFSAIISNASCILMDEATEGLDGNYVHLVQKMLKDTVQGRVLILVSHDYDFAAEVSDKLLFLKDGIFMEEAENLSLEELKKIYTQINGKIE